VHKIWWFYLQPFQRNLREYKNLKWITWPGPRPFQWWLAVRRLTFDMACKHIEFGDGFISHKTLYKCLIYYIWPSHCAHRELDGKPSLDMASPPMFDRMIWLCVTLTSKFNHFIFVECTKIVNLAKFPQAVYTESCSQTSGCTDGWTSREHNASIT